MSVNATAYHKTIGEMRHELVASAQDFEQMKDLHHKSAYTESTPAAVRDAYMAALMAAHYGYTLAAVIGVAEREFGDETARRLAFVADEILMNGDDSDRNADVMPGAVVEPI